MASYYEFFAGGGMARAGFGPEWECLFANDVDPRKGSSYAANWGDDHLKIEDVGKLTTVDLPDRADLAWASFPCQDLSLAGNYAGLKGKRSGAFWPFWSLIKRLSQEGRTPSLVVLENVRGALTSHEGKDFAAIGAALTAGGYVFGAVVMDAAHFVPQSRPRLFIIAIQQDQAVPFQLIAAEPAPGWHPPALLRAHDNLSPRSKAAWRWWKLPEPPQRQLAFADIIETPPADSTWHSAAETKRLFAMMSPVNLRKVRDARREGVRMVGGIYRRTRLDRDGNRQQRAEVRFDMAGCLRTPGGGSSRQSILILEGNRTRSRLLSPRETARLMGLPDSYILPENDNEAYHLTGDGVAPPVVRFLAVHLLEPLLSGSSRNAQEAA